MKTIAVNSIKGGTSKSTLSITFAKSLSGAGKKCLVIDADSSNHSVSFCFNRGISYETIQSRNIFNVFMEKKISDNVLKINENLDLLHGDVHLNNFRATPKTKILKKALKEIEYDFVIIDTAPAFDNILANIINASDTLVIPVQQDIYSHQALKYLFEQMTELDADNLEPHIIFSQFDKPRTENKEVFSNVVTDIFTEDELFKPFINPCHLSRSSNIKKYTNSDGFRINRRQETEKQYNEIAALVKSITGVTIGEEI
jgi:chromosome partitioning protein